MGEKKIYIKDESKDPIYKVRSARFTFRSRLLPAGLISLGILLLGSQVVYPLITFKSGKSSKPVESSVLGVVSGFRGFEFEELTSTEKRKNQEEVPEYASLTIPKLGIENAAIKINAESLDPTDALGHYRGSAIPGEVGNSFIYGHSVLPWFFNPENYKTIFSTLDKLEIGDEIYIEINGRKLTYKVEDHEILLPEEVEPLKEFKPKFMNESTITLMTCVPPGTKMKRLLVYAVME